MFLSVLLDRIQAFACRLWAVLGLEDEALEILGFFGTSGKHPVATILAVSAA